MRLDRALPKSTAGRMLSAIRLVVRAISNAAEACQMLQSSVLNASGDIAHLEQTR